jgi:hypothetical protein
MDQESGPATQGVPTEAQPQPQNLRRQLFAAAGERIYLIEKLQREVNLIKAQLDQEPPQYPPQSQMPEGPKESATQPS